MLKVFRNIFHPNTIICNEVETLEEVCYNIWCKSLLPLDNQNHTSEWNNSHQFCQSVDKTKNIIKQKEVYYYPTIFNGLNFFLRTLQSVGIQENANRVNLMRIIIFPQHSCHIFEDKNFPKSKHLEGIAFKPKEVKFRKRFSTLSQNTCLETCIIPGSIYLVQTQIRHFSQKIVLGKKRNENENYVFPNTLLMIQLVNYSKIFPQNGKLDTRISIAQSENQIAFSTCSSHCTKKKDCCSIKFSEKCPPKLEGSKTICEILNEENECKSAKKGTSSSDCTENKEHDGKEFSEVCEDPTSENKHSLAEKAIIQQMYQKIKQIFQPSKTDSSAIDRRVCKKKTCADICADDGAFHGPILSSKDCANICSDDDYVPCKKYKKKSKAYEFTTSLKRKKKDCLKQLKYQKNKCMKQMSGKSGPPVCSRLKRTFSKKAKMTAGECEEPQKKSTLPNICNRNPFRELIRKVTRR